MAKSTDGDRRDLEWDRHYASCAECQAYEGDGTLEQALKHLCPEGRELARAALEETTEAAMADRARRAAQEMVSRRWT